MKLTIVSLIAESPDSLTCDQVAESIAIACSRLTELHILGVNGALLPRPPIAVKSEPVSHASENVSSWMDELAKDL